MVREEAAISKKRKRQATLEERASKWQYALAEMVQDMLL